LTDTLKSSDRALSQPGRPLHCPLSYATCSTLGGPLVVTVPARSQPRVLFSGIRTLAGLGRHHGRARETLCAERLFKWSGALAPDGFQTVFAHSYGGDVAAVILSCRVEAPLHRPRSAFAQFVRPLRGVAGLRIGEFLRASA
jgi:hypothetical protein